METPPMDSTRMTGAMIDFYELRDVGFTFDEAVDALVSLGRITNEEKQQVRDEATRRHFAQF